MTFPTTRVKYRVRVEDSEGEKHIVFAYGRTEGEAKLNGLRIAQRLLQEQDVKILWIKPI